MTSRGGVEQRVQRVADNVIRRRKVEQKNESAVFLFAFEDSVIRIQVLYFTYSVSLAEYIFD